MSPAAAGGTGDGVRAGGVGGEVERTRESVRFRARRSGRRGGRRLEPRGHSSPERAYEAGYQPGRGYATMDPFLDSIRDRDRFRAVMERSLEDLEEMRRRIEAEEIAAGER